MYSSYTRRNASTFFLQEAYSTLLVILQYGEHEESSSSLRPLTSQFSHFERGEGCATGSVTIHRETADENRNVQPHILTTLLRCVTAGGGTLEHSLNGAVRRHRHSALQSHTADTEETTRSSTHNRLSTLVSAQLRPHSHTQRMKQQHTTDRSESRGKR